MLLARTASGGTQALDNVTLAIAVELALSPAKLATEEQIIIVLAAMQELSFIANSV